MKEHFLVAQLLCESNLTNSVYYHGSPDVRSFKTGKLGIHLGTLRAAKEALESRIGIPAYGQWDGKSQYGERLLMGSDKMKALGIWATGINADAAREGLSEDYFPKQRSRLATYSDGSPVPFSATPAIAAYRVVGKMHNRIVTDSGANKLMSRQVAAGEHSYGYFYKNEGEDAGSVSAVVPDISWLEHIDLAD